MHTSGAARRLVLLAAYANRGPDGLTFCRQACIYIYIYIYIYVDKKQLDLHSPWLAVDVSRLQSTQ